MCQTPSLHCRVSVTQSALPCVSLPVSIAMCHPICIAMCQSPSLHCHVSVTQSAFPCQSPNLHCHVSVTQSALPCVSRPWCTANAHTEYPHCICHCLNHRCCFAKHLDHQRCFLNSPVVTSQNVSTTLYWCTVTKWRPRFLPCWSRWDHSFCLAVCVYYFYYIICRCKRSCCVHLVCDCATYSWSHEKRSYANDDLSQCGVDSAFSAVRVAFCSLAPYCFVG